MSSRLVGRFVGWGVLAIALVSISIWYVTRDELPETIRIATSSRDSFYFEVGGALARYMDVPAGHEVVVVETAGSLDNLRMLVDGDVELAIFEASALPFPDVGVVSPLFSEVVHVVIRRDRSISAIPDLMGKRIVIGEPGSAMREDALKILAHYRMGAEDVVLAGEVVDDFLADASIDAVFVTTGLLSPTLGGLWVAGDFDVLPIEDSPAIALKHAHFFETEIPKGLYSERPPVPTRDTSSVATTALLAARADATARMVHHALEALYETDLRLEFTTLVSANEAIDWPLVPLHPLAQSYFRPYEGLDLLASFMESLAATKELLFALAAVGYLFWRGYQRMKSREDAVELQELKDRLDTFLDETIRIEKEQMKTNDPVALAAYLDEVTHIKLAALEQLSHEDLRGDRAFLIFLTQCANLIAKLQRKLESVSR